MLQRAQRPGHLPTSRWCTRWMGDKKARVEGAFVVAGDQVRFRLGSYDHSKALVIDPVLSYVTYLAGSSRRLYRQYHRPGQRSTVPRKDSRWTPRAART